MYRVLTSVTTCKQPTNNLLTCVIGLVSMLWSTGCIDEPKPHKCLFDKVANAQPPVSEDVAKTRYVDEREEE